MKTSLMKMSTVVVLFMALATNVFSMSETNLPLGRFEVDAGTHHEGEIFVDYPWVSQYRTFILRASGKMPQIKCKESPPGAGVLNTTDSIIDAGMGLSATISFQASCSTSLTSEIKSQVGIPEAMSVSGTTSGTVTLSFGISRDITASLNINVSLSPGEGVYPVTFLYYRDIYYATVQYNSGLQGYQYCYDCADWGATYSSITDIYSHSEGHATFYKNDGFGVAPSVSSTGSAQPLNIAPQVLSDGETLTYNSGKNWLESITTWF